MFPPKIPPYAKPGPYITRLPPPDELRFQAWVKQNNIPFDPGPQADYDMRGFWRAMQAGQAARSTTNLHFPDTYKTPYHQSFSNESIYATSAAPHWEGDRLVDQNGRVVFDESQGAQTRPFVGPQQQLPFGAEQTGLPGVPTMRPDVQPVAGGGMAKLLAALARAARK